MPKKIIMSKTLRSLSEAEYKPKPKRGRGHKLTIEQMQRLAKARGGKFLSDKYIGSQIKHTWQCAEGHEFKMTLANIKQGHWCPNCIKKRKIENMNKLAEIKGGKCLSTEYIDVKTKLKWQCAEDHKFEMKPSDVKQGKWCPKCNNEKKKLTIDEMHKLAEARGGKFLSEKYEGSLIKHKWQCAKGHEFEMRPNDVQQDHWCQKCNNEKKKLTIEQMHQIAEKHGGTFLSEKYSGYLIKHKWQCSEG
ncbi:hypothetical protein ACFL56_02930, partial [Candidatus Margulisiibacteriota bacterium]